MSIKRAVTNLLVATILGLAIAACTTAGATAQDPSLNQGSMGSFFSFLGPASVWDSMGDDFDLISRPYPQRVQTQINWFLHHKTYVQRLCKNAIPYIYYVYHQTNLRNMPAEIALLPMIESAYIPFGISHAGATGLWQMMPGTASGFGLKINWWYDGRRDIVLSTKGALDYLQYLHDFFHGDWLKAIAAYDSGEGTVQQAVRHNKSLHRPTDFWDLALPQETRQYVPRLLALAAIIEHADDYGINLPTVPNRPYFSILPMHTQLNISTIAHLAHISEKDVRTLNPAFRRWATVPNMSYYLLLPMQNASTFSAGLAKLPPSEKVTWMHHKVRPGETLSVLADKYHTTVAILKDVNDMKSSIIHVGHVLLVPMGGHGHFSAINRSKSDIAENALPGPHRVYHTVERGESLWTVARRYGLKVSQLRFWNKLGPHEDLHPGQKIMIWLQPGSYSTRAYHTYTVQSGDVLGKIAKKFGVSVSYIKENNDMKSDEIRVGQKLQIPYLTYKKQKYYGVGETMVVHHIKPGDTLNGLAHAFGVSAEDIAHWNHIHTDTVLHPGQRIVLYVHS